MTSLRLADVTFSYDDCEGPIVENFSYELDEGTISLISGPSASSLKRLADTVIEVGFYEPQPREVVLGSRNAMFYILDVLYAVVFNLDADKHTAMLKADYEYRRRNTESTEGL